MFDWSDFKILAGELRGRETEAEKRTAISRVYYAVYWQARNFLENDGFLIRQYEGSHIQIWNQYKQKSGQTNKDISRFGSELHRFRVQADYIAEIKDIEQLTEDHFKLPTKFPHIYSKSKTKRKTDDTDDKRKTIKISNGFR